MDRQEQPQEGPPVIDDHDRKIILAVAAFIAAISAAYGFVPTT